MTHKKIYRNQATDLQMTNLGNLIGVKFTKPMRKGTFLKLSRMANLTRNKSEDEKFDREVFWQQVAVYTDYCDSELIIGKFKN